MQQSKLQKHKKLNNELNPNYFSYIKEEKCINIQ